VRANAYSQLQFVEQADNVTVQRHIGNTFYYFGTGAE
jgi:hypothetical protein